MKVRKRKLMRKTRKTLNLVVFERLLISHFSSLLSSKTKKNNVLRDCNF